MSRAIGVGDVYLETKTGCKLELKHVQYIWLNLIYAVRVNNDGHNNYFGDGKWMLIGGLIALVEERRSVDSLQVG